MKFIFKNSLNLRIDNSVAATCFKTFKTVDIFFSHHPSLLEGQQIYDCQAECGSALLNPSWALLAAYSKNLALTRTTFRPSRSFVKSGRRLKSGRSDRKSWETFWRQELIWGAAIPASPVRLGVSDLGAPVSFPITKCLTLLPEREEEGISCVCVCRTECRGCVAANHPTDAARTMRTDKFN